MVQTTSSKPDRSNILLFTPDQLRADALGCFGNSKALTPNFDNLAKRGTRFKSAWSQHSVCGPSRISIMTGWYPHTAGHRTLDNLLKPWEPNLLKYLKDAGYEVALPGNRGDVFAQDVTEMSTDFCGNLVKPSWNWSDINFNGDQNDLLYNAFWFGKQGNEPRVDGDEATIQTAIKWLEQRTSDKPWAMWVPLLAPHPPFMVEDPWFSLHNRDSMPEPIQPEDTTGKPEYMNELRKRYGWADLSIEDHAEITATYYGMVSRVDDQLGRLLLAIDQFGYADNTYTFCFSDHGEYLGDHGLVEKWPSGLDPCLVQNPLIVAGPKVTESEVAHSGVEMIDLLPTCLEIAETEASHTHFGKSLLPILSDSNIEHREAVFCEGGFNPEDNHLFEVAGWIYKHKSEIQHEMPELVGKAQCVRTQKWSFIRRQNEQNELYDRERDPQEKVNILATSRKNDADILAITQDLQDRILEWLVQTSDVIPWQPDNRFPSLVHGWRQKQDNE